MSSTEIQSLVILGDDIYADIATAYLAAQMPSKSIDIIRLLKSESSLSTTIDTDHSIHAFHQDIGLDFDDLYRRGILNPRLVTTEKFAKATAYLESYLNLKDDLVLPHHQLVLRLMREGIISSYESISPLVALHKANKFHPHLHRLYRGDLRPYGVTLQAKSYSNLLREKSISQSVQFIQYKALNLSISSESFIDGVYIDNLHKVTNAFFLDMSEEQVLASCLKSTIEQSGGASLVDVFWLGNCLSLEQLKALVAKPANYFEWLYRSMVRLVDFFPDWPRMSCLSKEYNRLQTREYKQLTDFFSMLDYLRAGTSTLSDAVKHSMDLFAQSCHLSQDAANLAYPTYWPSLMISAGIEPQELPRRVSEIPLHYLKNWYDRRQRNIEEIVRRAQ